MTRYLLWHQNTVPRNSHLSYFNGSNYVQLTDVIFTSSFFLGGGGGGVCVILLFLKTVIVSKTNQPTNRILNQRLVENNFPRTARAVIFNMGHGSL